MLEAGFSRGEVEDSVNYLLNSAVGGMDKRGKVMKIPAIVRIVLMILVLASGLFVLVPSLNKMIDEIPSLVSTSMLGIFSLLVIIFYLGFAKLGKYSMNKLLRFTSLFLVVLLIIPIVLSSISYIIAPSSKTEASRSFGGDNIPFAFANSPLLSSGFGDLGSDSGDASLSLLAIQLTV